MTATDVFETTGELKQSLRAGVEAAQMVIDAWSEGDLAGATNLLGEWIEGANETIAKARDDAKCWARQYEEAEPECFPHTPGPWSVEIEEDGQRQYTPRALIPQACAEVGWSAGYGDADEKKIRAERIANANLIAAAPDLHAALVKLLKSYERRDMSGDPYVIEGYIVINETKAALTKAKGGVEKALLDMQSAEDELRVLGMMARGRSREYYDEAISRIASARSVVGAAINAKEEAK